MPTASAQLDKLDYAVRRRILSKIDWMATRPEILGRQPMKGMPADLRGLNKYRVGAWRIFYFVNHEHRALKIYGVKHRREAYR